MVPIVYTQWGLANRFYNPDSIELNENLKDHPKLQAQLLDHEFKHTNKKFTFYDFKHDLASQQQLDYKTLLVFMIKHPKTFSQFLPFYYNMKRKEVIYDLNLMLTYGIFFGIIGAGTMVGLKFL